MRRATTQHDDLSNVPRSAVMPAVQAAALAAAAAEAASLEEEEEEDLFVEEQRSGFRLPWSRAEPSRKEKKWAGRSIF